MASLLVTWLSVGERVVVDAKKSIVHICGQWEVSRSSDCAEVLHMRILAPFSVLSLFQAAQANQ